MNTVIINGKTYQGSGSISVNGDSVTIGGKKMKIDEKKIEITINGNIEDLDVRCANKILITGDVQKCRSTSGDIKVKGSILGDVQASSGDIEAETIEGDVSTSSGDVKAKEIKGKCKTFSGDIN